MIYLLTGNKKERKEYIYNLCREQGIDIETIQHFYNDSFKEISFYDSVSADTGLFAERECFVFHDAVRDLEVKDILKNYLHTPHLLIFSEDSILKKDQNIFEKAGISLNEFSKEQKIEETKYNTFALADLLGKRDKKNLWLGFREAIEMVSAEEIHGILWWQIKNLALVKKSTKNPGLSPFVYSKNQSFVKNFTDDEIKKMSHDLIHMFHTRDTYCTLEIDLEKFILSL